MLSGFFSRIFFRFFVQLTLAGFIDLENPDHVISAKLLNQCVKSLLPDLM